MFGNGTIPTLRSVSCIKVANITTNSVESGPLGPQAAGWNVANEGVAGTFQIVCVQSGLALDGGVDQVGTNPQMYQVNGTVGQQWVLQ